MPAEEEQDNAEADQEHDSDRNQKGNEDLLEEVSEQGSELFETDSSDDQEGCPRNAGDQHSSMGSEKILTAAGQGRDIVAGSPTKAMAQPDQPLPAEAEQAPDRGRQEMGGTIVYDSYAELTGCEKIVQYFSGRPLTKVNPYILFSKEEAKEAAKGVFGDKARERDFYCEYDRYLFKNLPRFQTQRDFSKP